MFPSSVIRKLANSEEMLAETENFVGLAADVKGPIDIDMLETAYDALLETRPYLTTRIERGPDGRHQLVADDLVPEGIEVVELDRRCTSTRTRHWFTFGSPFVTGRPSRRCTCITRWPTATTCTA